MTPMIVMASALAASGMDVACEDQGPWEGRGSAGTGCAFHHEVRNLLILSLAVGVLEI